MTKIGLALDQFDPEYEVQTLEHSEQKGRHCNSVYIDL